MKTVIYSLLAAVLFVTGCNHDSAPALTNDQPTPRAVDNKGAEKSINKVTDKSQTTTWDPALFVGGDMFRNSQQFDAYVRGSQIIATGVMTEWNGTNGTVRVDSVIHGKLNDKSVKVSATGGFSRPEPGEQVLFLLSPRDGKLKLHSMCSAGGMYKYSDDLAAAIKSSLKPEGKSNFINR